MLWRLEVVRAEGQQAFFHMGVEQGVEVVDIQGFIPVLIDMVCPGELALDYPAIILPGQYRGFTGDDVVLEQAAIEKETLVIGDEVSV